jgi:hypothetical protein
MGLQDFLPVIIQDNVPEHSQDSESRPLSYLVPSCSLRAIWDGVPCISTGAVYRNMYDMV